MNQEGTTKAVAQAGDKYIVRFPEGMRERIAEAARANNRSMNAEIVARLQGSFDGGVKEPRHDFILLLAKLQSTIAKTERRVDELRFKVAMAAITLRSVLDGVFQAKATPEQLASLRAELESDIEENGDAVKLLGNRLTLEHVADFRVSLLSDRLARIERGEVVDDDGMPERVMKLADAIAQGFDPARAGFLEHGILKNTASEVRDGENSREIPISTAVASAAPGGITSEYSRAGNLNLKGDREAIKAILKAGGITNFVPMRGGIQVAVSQAQAAAKLIEGSALGGHEFAVAGDPPEPTAKRLTRTPRK